MISPEQDLENITKQLTALRCNPSSFLYYNNEDRQWQPYVPYSHKLQPMKQIRSVTLNVLTDILMGREHRPKIIYSKQRYIHILNKTSEMNADIITFNQVTKSFNQLLKAQKWVQQGYYISEFNVKLGNLLLTATPPIFFDRVPIKGINRPIQIAFLPCIENGYEIKITCFCSVHLSALSSNVKKRDKQLNELMQYISRYEKYTSRFILQGDMNFHSEDQNYMLEKFGMRDLWVLKYGNPINNPDKGYTFDSLRNSMINEIYWGFEKRRMRLDRILVKGNSSNIKIKQMKVVFDQQISATNEKLTQQQLPIKYHGFVKGSLLFVHDLAGFTFGRGQKESYLFPSDHFGLLVELQLQK